MLTITGSKSSRFCDGFSRRDFLKIGALGGALTLADMVRARAQAEGAVGRPSSSKGVIVVFLSGGASQLDTYDLKPDAPREIRGPYNPIRTNVPGIDICEWLPETAKMMDKIALLRTVVPAIDEHSDSNVMTGRAGEPGVGASSVHDRRARSRKFGPFKGTHRLTRRRPSSPSVQLRQSSSRNRCVRHIGGVGCVHRAGLRHDRLRRRPSGLGCQSGATNGA